MSSHFDRDLRKLAAGKHSLAALTRLAHSIKYTDRPQVLRTELIISFEALPRATSQLVCLLDSSDAAYDVLEFLFSEAVAYPVNILHTTFWKVVTSSENGPSVVKALINKGTSSRDGSIFQCAAISFLTFFTSKDRDLAREAAQQGAIGKLARIVERSKDDDLVEVAAEAIIRIVEDSTLRAKQATREGAIQPLSNVLGSPRAQETQRAAAAALACIFDALPCLPDHCDPKLLEFCFTQLIHTLPLRSTTDQTKVAACLALVNMGRLDKFLGAEIAAAMATTGAYAALVLLIRRNAHESASIVPVMALLSGMAILHPWLHQGQAAAVVDAGGIELAKQLMNSDDNKIRSGAALLLQALSNISDAYAAAIGEDNVRAASSAASAAIAAADALAAQHAARESACAACGKTSGGGRDGKLMQCSACKKLFYCSKACQARHWKVHKPDCRIVSA